VTPIFPSSFLVMSSGAPTGWEGRCWLSSTDTVTETSHNKKKQLKFCSYNVLSDASCSKNRHSTTKNWIAVRRTTLLREINSYNADIICLQDVDHFYEWWRPQLASLGYDSIYKQRTSLRSPRVEGVVVAYRRGMFQLYKSVPIELNGAVEFVADKLIRDKVASDDVGLLAFLQPFKIGCMDTALCVASVAFCDRDGDTDVRTEQCKYFMRQLEVANQQFHVPVVLGVSLFDDPSSASYHILATGRMPVIGDVPGKCRLTSQTSSSRGTFTVKWMPPKQVVGNADRAVDKFIVAWRSGGSEELAFDLQKEYTVAECTQYTEKIDANGRRRIVANEELSVTITGLSSGIAYEFRVAAVNEVGRGEWSEPSIPQATLALRSLLKNKYVSTLILRLFRIIPLTWSTILIFISCIYNFMWTAPTSTFKRAR
jgi:Fibronectin type III domain/Endonuclease/Exonuclease/phosphatase family